MHTNKPNTCIKLLLATGLLLCTIALHAQYFRNIGLRNGLSQLSVICICQDSVGRMWFGTREGVNTYDGHRMEHHKAWVKAEDGTPLWLGNFIGYVQCAANGDVYLLADKNLYRHDTRTGRFARLTDGNTTTTCHVHRGSVWYAKQDSIFKWDCHARQARHLPMAAAPKAVTALAVTAQGELCIGTQSGLLVTDTTATVPPVRLMEGNAIYGIYESRKQELWIATRQQGLWKRSSRTDIPRREPQAGNEKGEEQVRELAEDQTGNIWYGTFAGLYKYDAQSGQHTKASIQPHQGTLAHPSIYALCRDRQGTIWAGTWHGGVTYFNPAKEEIRHYDCRNTPVQDHNMTYPCIGDMQQDKHGNLWMATDGAGIQCLDKDWNLRATLTAQPGNPNALPHNNVKSIAYDPHTDCLFIATYLGGLARYDLATRRFTNYARLLPPQSPHNPGDIIYCVKMWRGNLYLTSRKGLFRLDPHTDRLTFLSDRGSYCEHFDIDPEGNIYLMAWNSIRLLSLARDTPPRAIVLAQYGCPAAPNRVLATDRGVCIGTQGMGLLYFNTRTRTMSRYDSQNSLLPGDYCYNIARLDSTHLVISSDKGVSLFNPLNNAVLNLNLPDGTQAVSGGGIYVSPRQDIYVGDTEGVTLFPRKAFGNAEEKKNNIYFARLEVDNQPAEPGMGILPRAMPYARQLELKHHQNNFTIEFASSDYKNTSRKTLHQYMLRGLDTRWNTTAGYEMHYTNLDPGSYTLLVRPLNGTERQTIALDIRIRRPWWNTPGAWLCYLLAVGAATAYLVRNRMVKRRLALSLEREHREKVLNEEAARSKLLFFTNVSHEFRTPLTLLVSHIDSLMQHQLPVQLYNKMIKIRQNAQYMTNLVSELLDFNKFDRRQATLHLRRQDLCMLLEEIHLTFTDYAQQRGIDYTYRATPASIPCWADAGQLEKVLFNLLSNAFKHTPQGGSIALQARMEGDSVQIHVTDSGTGIAPRDLPHIFDRFFQTPGTEANAANPGTGIGLALTKSIVEAHHGSITVQSTLRQGSHFTVTLPTAREAYQNDPHIRIEEEEQAERQDALLSSRAYLQSGLLVCPDIPLPRDNDLLRPAEDLADGGTPDEEPRTADGDEADSDKKHTLLIVEDNPELIQVLSEIFAPYYRIQTAANGKEGLASTFEHKPDIIVSDIMMPEMTGTEMCLRIKNNIDLCHIPVVLLTALNSTEQNIEGLNRGADDYITKPFDPRILLARTNNLLRNRMLIQHQLNKNPLSEVDLTSINPLDQKLLHKVTDIIERHIDDPDFDIPSLCQEVGMGRSQLYAKFKVLVGMTPNNFLLNCRLKHAATLLQKYPDLPLAEVGDRSGFSSTAYFSRCFKAQYNDTPQAYRRKQQEKAMDK